MIAEILQNKNITGEILGINRRNQEYVRPYNPRWAKQIVDSKLLTKRLLSRIKIKTPELFFVIRSKKQVNNLDWSNLPKSFVIKPNRGTGGNGIIVFYGKQKKLINGQQAWIRPNGQIMTQRDIQLHIENILDGRFSMGEEKDIAIIEERLKNDTTLKQYSYKGVPDVRVIVFKGVPIMAELRIPTKESNGTANLHAGGIGVGIDLASGLTTIAIHRNKKSLIEDIYELVDSTLDLDINLPLRGFKIPYWNEILDISIKCQKASGLGFAGVDIAIDRDNGPMVFELNARPGLAIQIANMCGLRDRLELVKKINIKNDKHGIRIAKDLFGGQVEEDIEQLSGKEIVNLVEKIIVYHKPTTKIKLKKNKIKIKQKTSTIKGLLDTGITTSRIDDGLAAQIGFAETIKNFNKLDIPRSFENYADAQEFIDKVEKVIIEKENNKGEIVRLAKIFEDGKIRVKPVIEIDIKMRGLTMKFETIISTQKEMIFPLLIGRKELKGFLIDPSKTFVR